MLRGKYWITPRGVMDVSTTEHKIAARRVMLLLEDGGVDYPQARTEFTYMPRDYEVAALMRKPGVYTSAVWWLRQGKDERIFAMYFWNWVRVAKNAFYAWELDEKTLKQIRDARDYWFGQTPWEPGSVVDFIETSCWKQGAIPIEYLFSDGPKEPAFWLRKKYITTDWREK